MRSFTAVSLSGLLVCLLLAGCGLSGGQTSEATTNPSETPTPTIDPSATPTTVRTNTPTPNSGPTFAPGLHNLVRDTPAAPAGVAAGSDSQTGTSNTDTGVDYGRDCPAGKVFDPTRGFCVANESIDCGPSPYQYNELGGHWERVFYEVCWPVNGDGFERLFSGMTYAQVSGVLAERGLEGLSHAEQVVALDAQGYTGGAVTVAPVCPEGFVLNEAKGRCVEDSAIDCGPNPYAFNDVLGKFERDFNKWCFENTRDPFEILFHRMGFNRAQSHLESVGLGGLTHDEQVAGLVDLGYWDTNGFVPEGASVFPR